MHTHEWLITYSYNSELGHTEMSAVCDADPFDCEEMLGYDEIHRLLNSHADLLEALEKLMYQIVYHDIEYRAFGSDMNNQIELCRKAIEKAR